MFTKKYILMFVTLLMLFPMVGFSQSAQDAAAGEGGLKPLQFLLDWRPGEPRFIGVYYAIDTGEFEKAGYELSLASAVGATLAAGLIGGGKYPIGIASGAAVVLARGNEDAPVKSLGALYKDTSSVVYGIASKTMATEPKDLEGMTVGFYRGSPAVREFDAFVQANKLNESTIEKFSLIRREMPLLMDGTLGAVVQYNESIPARFDVEQSVPEIDGKRTWRIMLRDYGVKSYGMNVIANDRALEEQGDEMQKIAQAVYNGYQKACANDANKAAAVSGFLERFHRQYKGYENYVSHSFAIVCSQLIQPVGSQTKQGWQGTIDFFVGTGLLKEGAVKPEDVFVNE